MFTGCHAKKKEKKEEKAKVMAAAWLALLIQFLATLAIIHQDDLKNRMNCTRTILRIGCIHSFLQIIQHGAK